MKFIQIQDMFLLIELAERIFLDADDVFRGLPPEGWYLPGVDRRDQIQCFSVPGDRALCGRLSDLPDRRGAVRGKRSAKARYLMGAVFLSSVSALRLCAGYRVPASRSRTPGRSRVFPFEDGVCRLDGREAVSYAGRTPEGEWASGAGKTKPPVCVLRPGIFCRHVVSFALAGYREPAASDLYRHRLAVYAGIYPHLANIPSPHAVTRPYGL